MKIQYLFSMEDILGSSSEYEIESNFEQVIRSALYQKVGYIHTIDNIDFIKKTETGFVVEVTVTTLLVHEKTTFYWSLEDFVYEVGFIAGDTMDDRIRQLLMNRVAEEHSDFKDFPIIIERFDSIQDRKNCIGFAVQYMILDVE